MNNIKINDLVRIDWSEKFFLKTIINYSEIGFDFKQLNFLNSTFNFDANSTYKINKIITHILKFETMVIYEIIDKDNNKYQIPSRIVYKIYTKKE